jgi:hypothetical protein
MTSIAPESDVVGEEAAIVVAPVTRVHHPSPLFEDHTHDDGIKEYEARRSRRELYFVLTLAALVVSGVVITVSVVAVSGRKPQRSNFVKALTSSPTMAPTVALLDAQAKLDYITQQLKLNNYTKSYLSDLPTKASQLKSGNGQPPVEDASEWLVNVDILVNEKNMIRRLALATIYYQNGGTNWTNTSNWLSSKGHCDWFGVTCCKELIKDEAPTCFHEDPDAIIDLNLGDNHLSGPMTPIYALLTDLRSLDLSFNQLTGECLACFPTE